jgi:twitching motility two-component system response regulator PilH
MALIMIVDDSPTEVHVMKTALEQHGFNTVSAANGSECLTMAREMRPDLILMDVVMPGINGFQATRTLSKDPRTASIPVVMISTKDQETDRIWAMRQGAVDYLTKPVTAGALIAKAQEILQRAGDPPTAGTEQTA